MADIRVFYWTTVNIALTSMTTEHEYKPIVKSVFY